MGLTMTKILPGLYVGSLGDTLFYDRLVSSGVTHILSVHDFDKPIMERKSLNYLRIHLSDDPNEDILKYISSANDFIHQARLSNGICLVHCVAGVSRSVSLCVAYVMTLLNKQFEEVFYSIKGFRHQAGPNKGFCDQLIQFGENQLTIESERFFKLHGQWTMINADAAVIAKGYANFQDYIVTGRFGLRIADYDERPSGSDGVDGAGAGQGVNSDDSNSQSCNENVNGNNAYGQGSSNGSGSSSSSSNRVSADKYCRSKSSHSFQSCSNTLTND